MFAVRKKKLVDAGFMRRLEELASQITYEDAKGFSWSFAAEEISGRPCISWTVSVEDSYHPGRMVDLHHHTWVSADLSDEGILVRVISDLDMFEHHEMTEHFKVGGEVFLNEHDPVQAMSLLGRVATEVGEIQEAPYTGN